MSAMVGRKVRCIYPAVTGVVEAWEPLSADMCDVLVCEESGKLRWYASASLREADGLGPLPSRSAARTIAQAQAVRELEAIRAAHTADKSAWPGAEFGKAILGKAIDGALAGLSTQKGSLP